MIGTIDGFSTATAMLAALRNHQVSAVELLDLHLRRIESHDSRVNAVVIRDFERARDAAVAADVAHSTEPFHRRTASINGRTMSLRCAMAYASLPIVAGLPATALPIGLSRDGLPIGIQAIGPFLEDRTPIQFARVVAEQLGGFQRPPGFDLD